MSKAERPTFVLVVRPEKGVDPIRALRGLLKLMLRRFGLRCVEIGEGSKKERGDEQREA